jgi:hypothetical protein
MYSETLYQKIEDFLNKQMDAQQMSTFEAEMQSNPEIEKLVNAHRQADLVIAHGLKADRKAKLKKIDLELDQQLEAENPVSKGKVVPLWRKIAIAASFILVAALAIHFWNHESASPQLIAQSYFIEVNHQVRGDQNGKSPYQLMEEAEAAFKKDAFAEAISLYDQVIDGKSLLSESASLNKALSLLSNQQLDKAKKILEEIKMDDDHQYQEVANQILKKLN